MKRISLLLAMAIFSTTGFSQKNILQSAIIDLGQYKLDMAMKSINRCVNDPSNSKDAKAWFIRGNIYLEIASSKDEKFKTLDPDALQQAMISYKKATEFDQKNEYKEDIFNKVNWQRNNYFNKAVENFNKKLYKEAMIEFENGANVLALINESDTASLFYAAVCAGLANEKTKAKQFYIDMLKQNAKSPAIYISLSDLYKQEKDSASAIKIIKAGQNIYPDDMKLLHSETNIYLTFGNTQKALRNLKLATEKDKSNPTVFFALGTIYDNLSNDIKNSDKVREESFILAINAYKSAIKINPDYFDANYNLGALNVNKAANINDQANNLPLDADVEYKKLTEEANKYLEEAMPYLEKASEINPEDLSTLNSLKQIYTRLKKTDKLKIIDEKIAAIKK
jgi:hypothetical protein